MREAETRVERERERATRGKQERERGPSGERERAREAHPSATWRGVPTI